METQSFLFGCCSGFEGLNNQESEIRSLIRSAITKGKKTNLASLAHSPESSLKTFKSMKNLNNLENFNVCNSTISHNEGEKRSKLTSAREIPVTYYLNKIDKFLSPCSNQLRREVNSDHKEFNTLLSIPSIKNNIKFSYNKESNPKKKSEAPPSHLELQRKKSETGKSQMSNRKSNFTTLASEYEFKNNEKEDIEEKLKEKKSWISHKCEESMIKLGSSRLTIKSTAEIEEDVDKDIKIDESCIVIDVFNASDSQVKKWDHSNNI